MDEYTTDGMIIKGNGGFMGIFSAVSLLNEKIKEIDELKKKLREELKFANDLVASWNDRAERESEKLEEALEVIKDISQGGCSRMCVSNDCNCACLDAREFLAKIEKEKA